MASFSECFLALFLFRPCGAPGREMRKETLRGKPVNPPHMSPDSDCILCGVRHARRGKPMFGRMRRAFPVKTT